MNYAKWTKTEEFGLEDMRNYMNTYYHGNSWYDDKLNMVIYCAPWIKEIVELDFRFKPEEFESIISNIKSNKLIPSLRFLPSSLQNFTKQLWWFAPLTIWKEDVCSFAFVDKNGFHVLKEIAGGEVDILFAFPFDKAERLEFERNIDDQPIDRITLFQENGQYLTFDETKEDGHQRSHLEVIYNIWEVREPTITASKGKPMWAEGYGGEGYTPFHNKSDILQSEKWTEDIFRPDPRMFGF